MAVQTARMRKREGAARRLSCTWRYSECETLRSGVCGSCSLARNDSSARGSVGSVHAVAVCAQPRLWPAELRDCPLKRDRPL
eukprot:5149650-Pleurochrysis_carterae.AAC.1